MWVLLRVEVRLYSMKLPPGVLGLLLASTCVAQISQVTTSQYDSGRTGANLHETQLTPLTVNASRFGKLASLKVDGDVYAEPLYFAGVDIPGKGKHNVLFVATEHDSVYAFDSDTPGEPLWKVSFLSDGVKTLSTSDVDCPFITPEVGITSTPVLDPISGTLYVLARTKESRSFFSSYSFVQKLHALAITTGVEKFGGPAVIDAKSQGRGDGAQNGTVSFEQQRENPRAALLLVNNTVYASWGSSCDAGPYHGWVLAYDAATLKIKAGLNVSPNADDSGIWAGDVGPAADQNGNVYVATGNGRFDASVGGMDYGDTVLKLQFDQGALKVADYFTPSNEQELNEHDSDLGSGGPVLLPNDADPHRHLLVIAGKGATLYVIDRDHMGKFDPANDRHAVQTIPLHDSAFGAVAYWNHHVYQLVSKDWLRDYELKNGRVTLHATGGGHAFIDPGATPTVSANGNRDGVVWVVESKGWRSPDRPFVLHAYDAANIDHELYTSEQNAARDRGGLTLRFNIPLVVNGRVYVGAKREVDVYGLLPETK